MHALKNSVVFIMGVSGVGKSTIGEMLSKDLGIPFFDGDDYHPVENIEKMTKGMPLNDKDRAEWLVGLNRLVKDQLNNNGCILACSALKKHYREILENGIADCNIWIHLYGSYDLIKSRMEGRSGHFMPINLLKSQLETLEEDQNAIKVNINNPPEAILRKLKESLTNRSEIGLFGLGVMGKSLARNLANNAFKISMYNRHVPGVEENVAVEFKNDYPELTRAKAFDDLPAFVTSLQKPRKILLMVNAGKILDSVIDNITPLLSAGDTLIDGGNSNYKKTRDRYYYLSSQKINFLGVGISGGEEGALKGPSIMPGGDADIFDSVKPYLEAISAKDGEGKPCCTYIGKDGSGHFVKMIHNGIEYAEMQLLSEIYWIFKNQGKSPDEIADEFQLWENTSSSYLLDITIQILVGL